MTAELKGHSHGAEEEVTLAGSHLEKRVHVSHFGLPDTTETTISKAHAAEGHQEGRGLELLPCKERDRTELFQPGEKVASEGPRVALQHTGDYKNSTDRLFTAMLGGRVLWQQSEGGADERRHRSNFTPRSVNLWNKLPKQSVQSLPLNFQHLTKV